jgi:hypothetical protein
MIASQKKLDLEARTKAYNEAIATNEGNFTARIVNRAKLVPE